jgi:hypothetical protein
MGFIDCVRAANESSRQAYIRRAEVWLESALRAERPVVALGRRNQILPLLVLRRSSSAWRRAELFISERDVLAREQQRHEYPFTFPTTRSTEKQILFFGTSDSLYNYYVEAMCFGCGHQEENKWIRRSPVFWALRLH